MIRTLRVTGFTLIEILSVIAIIGVISTLSIGPIRSAQQRSRDAQRKTDINVLAQALELYYSENRTLPGQETNGTCTDTYTTRSTASPWIPGLTQRYLPTSTGQKQPVDPRAGDPKLFYTYTNFLCLKKNNPSAVTNGQAFKLEAVLENKKDTDGVANDDGDIVYEVTR